MQRAAVSSGVRSRAVLPARCKAPHRDSAKEDMASLPTPQVSLWLAADAISRQGLPLRFADGVRFTPSAAADDAERRSARLDPERLRAARSVYLQLVLSNVRDAACRLRRTYERSSGQDGLVELGCTPEAASDAAAAVAEAVSVLPRVGARNVVFRVPATDAGIAALHELTYRGISAAVDGVFGRERYEKAAEAYVSALERRLAGRRPLAGIASLVWIPVAALDEGVDALLATDSPLCGAVAVATAQQLHLLASGRFAGRRWRRLVAHGAQPQRVAFSALTRGGDERDMSCIARLTLPGTVLALGSKALTACATGAGLVEVEADETEIAWVLAEVAAAGARLPAIADALERATEQRAAHAYARAVEAIADRRRTHRPRPAEASC
jgi:hypothetical protein